MTGRGETWSAPQGVLRVALLLGKPPERSPALPEVISRLLARGADVRVHLPHREGHLPDWLPASDVVGLRGLREEALAAVADLERRGLHCCNSAAATIAVRDRSLVQRRLAEAGLPVPGAATVAGRRRCTPVGSPRPVLEIPGRPPRGHSSERHR